MTAADHARRLGALIRRLRAAYPDAAPVSMSSIGVAPEWCEPVVEELLFSFYMWESTSAQARAAMKRVRESVMDYNELRLLFTDELVALTADRGPRAIDRADRVRAALREIYLREHSVSLAHLPSRSKRDSSSYLESLPGVPPFVASRVTLLACGGHAVPVDARLRDLLSAEGLAERDASPATVAGWLERHVRASDAAPTHAVLQAWSDDRGGHTAGAARTRSRRTDAAAPRARRAPRKKQAKSAE